MAKFSFEQQPKLRLLSDQDIEKIHEKALHILENTGVKFYAREALEILEENGVNVDYDEKIARFPSQLVNDAVKKVPETLKLYDREGENFVDLGGDRVHFDPGSAAIKFMESDGKTVRKAVSDDLVKISRVNNEMDNIELQSSSVVLYDIPAEIGDCYRLYIMLKNSSKPILTGGFSIEGITNMREMLAAIAGGYDELKEKPRSIFDICPSPPLKWTEISSHNIIDCARFGLPIETISMPMMGAASPATISGSILLHTAETLSGIVLAQSVNTGTPVVYGGAPVNFDMRMGTSPLSAVEATMIAAGYAQMGKYYGMPTHTYACLSDSKVIDAQAGLETGISGIIAQLAGINVISGPGILEFVGCMSLEKLVIDNDICGIALRLNRGISCSEDALAADLIAELGPGKDYLATEHTIRWFKKESYFPTDIINRQARSNWENDGNTTAFERAQKQVKEILARNQSETLAGKRRDDLDQVMKNIMEKHDISNLPQGPV